MSTPIAEIGCCRADFESRRVNWTQSTFHSQRSEATTSTLTVFDRDAATIDGVPVFPLFGGTYPSGQASVGVSRADIADWVGALTKAGKSPTTVRHQYFVVKRF